VLVSRRRAALAALRGDESGFSMPELVTVMLIVGVIAAGGSMLVEVVMRQGRGVVERTDAMQRGRIVLDQITRQVRSAVCLDSATRSLVDARADRITFYADLSDGSRPLQRRTLRYEPAARTIVEDVYQGAGTPLTFPVTPSSSKVLLQNVSRDAAGPMFRYYAYTATTPPSPSLTLPVPLVAADLQRAARIEIAFAARPFGAKDDKNAVQLREDVQLRNANPNAARPDPTCT
jgi:prepilin-type N-terminal cleavage/methylation domain-containing protein